MSINTFRTLAISATLLLGMASQALAENPVVTMKTSMGEVEIELYPEQAPISVENFLQYVDDEAYNGTIFHRVIKGFMNQGGGIGEDNRERDKRAPIKNEADNGLKNQRGTIAMARTSQPHSASNQFFINTVDNSFLNHKDKSSRGWGYTVFGKVTSGMEVMDKIAEVKTVRDNPVTPVVIETIARK